MELAVIIIIIIFAGIWLISPIVLGIICICQHSELKKLRSALSESKGERTLPSYYPPPAAANRDTEKSAYVSAPAAINRDTAKSAYAGAPSAQKTEGKKSVSTVNVILILGAMFISLAGFVFAAAAWGSLGTFFKSAVLLSFSAVFFVLHIIADKKLRLDMTARVFFTLGSVFLPAAVAAAAILRIFGDYFSFSGDGRLLVFSLMGALLCVCFFAGAALYKSKNYARIAYTAFTCAAASLIVHASPDDPTAALLLAVYALLTLLLTPIIEQRSTGVIFSEYGYFTNGNIWILAAISLFLSGDTALFVAPAVIFSLSFFLSSLKSRQPAAGVSAFALYLLIGSYLGIRPAQPAGIALIAALVMIVYTCLSLLNIIPPKAKGIMRKIRNISAAAVAVFGFIASAGEPFALTSLIAAAAVTVQLAVVIMLSGDRYSRYIFFGVYIWLAFEAAKGLSVIFPAPESAALIFSSAVFTGFAVIKNTPLKKYFYTLGADILACAALILAVLSHDAFLNTPAAEISLWLFCIAAAFISGHDTLFGRAFAPFAAFSAAYPIYNILRGSYIADSAHSAGLANDCVCIILLLYCALAALTLIKPLRKFAVPFSLGIPITLICYLFIIEDGPFVAVTAAIAAYCALNFAANINSRRFTAYGSAFLAMLCLNAFELGRLCIDGYEAAVFPSALLLIMFGAYLLSPYGGRMYRVLGSFLLYALGLCGVILTLISTLSPPLFVCTAAVALCGGYTAYSRRNAIPMYILMPFVYYHAYNFFYSPGHSQLAALAVMMTSFGIIGRLAFAERAFFPEKKRFSDFFTLSCLSGVVLLLFDGKYEAWTGYLFLGLTAANLIRHGHSAKLNRFFMTVSSLALLPVWWTQPFFTLPDIILTEWQLLPVAIVCLLIRIIHKERRTIPDNISFAAAIISLIILFADAADTGLAADAVILGGIILSLLACSFILRQKRWFVLSVAAAVSEALLLTLRLYNSSTWWIYLLAAGIILIALGMINEIKKQKAKNGDNTGRFMSDWKW